MNKYPKVLLVNGTGIGAPGGTGISLANIFKGWPKDCLLQLVPEAYREEDNHSDAGFTVIMLPKSSVPFEFLFRKLFSFVFKKSIWSEATGEKAENIIQKVSFKSVLKAWVDTSPVHINKKILKEIEEFQPDVIYTMLGSIKICKMANKIAKKTGARVVLHFMDDWIEQFYASTKLTFYPRMVLYGLFQKLLAKTTCNLAISKPMAKEYEKRYGKQFEAMMNSVPDVFTTKETSSDKIKFIYMGGLHLKRWQSLSVIANELKSYENATMEIYTPTRDAERYQDSIVNKNIIFRPPVKPERVQEIIADADVTVFCESFDSDVREFITYSLSTKIPEYMASGRPILYYGPKGLASAQYIEENGSGLLASTEDELKQAITMIISDQTLRIQCGQKGIDTAKQNHLQKKVHEKLTHVLQNP